MHHCIILINQVLECVVKDENTRLCTTSVHYVFFVMMFEHVYLNCNKKYIFVKERQTHITKEFADSFFLMNEFDIFKNLFLFDLPLKEIIT